MPGLIGKAMLHQFADQPEQVLSPGIAVVLVWAEPRLAYAFLAGALLARALLLLSRSRAEAFGWVRASSRRALWWLVLVSFALRALFRTEFLRETELVHVALGLCFGLLAVEVERRLRPYVRRAHQET